jgi:hypothetical protein
MGGLHHRAGRGRGWGVTDTKTTFAMTTAEAKEVFAATGKVAQVYHPGGAT